MDETKEPGIAIKSIHLLSCSASVTDVKAALKYSIGLSSLSRKTDGSKLVVIAAFDMMHGVAKPPCNITCTFIAIYLQSEPPNMTWDEFSDVMAVTHMIPYVREFVSSVTLRMPIRELIIPPVNAHLLISEYKNDLEKNKDKVQST